MTDDSTKDHHVGDAFQDGDPKTEWLLEQESWLQLLARMEIDSRFQGKFSPSDAVQQTLMEAWRGWEGCRATDHPQRLAWLRKILAHQLAHLARRYAGTQKRDVKREVSIEQSLAQSSMQLGRLLPADATSPSAQLMTEERHVQVASILQRLPPEYRQVIVLRNLQELSHAEVAEKMNRSEGAVRMLWVRALERLRAETVKLEGGP